MWRKRCKGCLIGCLVEIILQKIIGSDQNCDLLLLVCLAGWWSCSIPLIVKIRPCNITGQKIWRIFICTFRKRFHFSAMWHLTAQRNQTVAVFTYFSCRPYWTLKISTEMISFNATNPDKTFKNHAIFLEFWETLLCLCENML